VARERSPHRGAWMLAGLAAVCLGGGAAAALIGDNGNAGNGGQPHVRSSSRQADTPAPTPKAKATPKPSAAATPSSSAAAATSTQPSSTAPGTPTTPAASADGRSPAQLNNAGYAMLP